LRKYKFDEYYRANLPLFSREKIRTSSRKIRKRPRPPEEWEGFFILMKSRWERWEREGILKRLGRRKYQIKL